MIGYACYMIYIVSKHFAHLLTFLYVNQRAGVEARCYCMGIFYLNVFLPCYDAVRELCLDIYAAIFPFISNTSIQLIFCSALLRTHYKKPAVIWALICVFLI
ncbi:hypothetical protein QBC37DRAFT_23572 [Rhypophila decipiens]|uniref:Uncharacterized protein n=1 Tax=Rhypophila decipiens TaxID=261697 RepID=A0AAN7B5D9_9PEZI|nr:hypothetical protein QBC37DRAFT_23572 [Rhypophila decipiens]